MAGCYLLPNKATFYPGNESCPVSTKLSCTAGRQGFGVVLLIQLSSVKGLQIASDLSRLIAVCFAAGGYDGQTFLDSVECYDSTTDTWTEVTCMTSGRSGVGVAITMEPCCKQTEQQKCHC